MLLAKADWPNETFSPADLGLQLGDSVEMTDVLFTAHRLGPLLLVTNLDFLEDACFWYRKRFGIETSSRARRAGAFPCATALQQNLHWSDPARLCRLLMATCLAYYWLVCLDTEVVQHGWQSLIHREKRCDLSLFQLGRTWLTHCLNEGFPVPVRLQLRHVK